MNARAVIDWQSLFVERIREIQGLHPCAHRELVNWGLWSRELRGIFAKGVVSPGFWKDIDPEDRPGWAEEPEDEGTQRYTGEVKSEPPEEPEADEKRGEAMDIRVHQLGDKWRAILKRCYCYRLEIRYAPNEEQFLCSLNDCLAFLESEYS